MTKVSTTRQRQFEDLYRQHRLDVLAYCTRRLGRVDAADACSAVFLAVWRKLDDIPQSPETLPYLYGIARRVVSNETRSLRRRGRLDARLAALGVAVVPDPSLLVVQNADTQEILAAVRRLKPKDREIVMLYAWEDLSRETIAQMMDMTRSALDQRIHRANKRLAQILRARPELIPSPPIAQEGGGS